MVPVCSGLLAAAGNDAAPAAPSESESKSAHGPRDPGGRRRGQRAHSPGAEACPRGHFGVRGVQRPSLGGVRGQRGPAGWVQGSVAPCRPRAASAGPACGAAAIGRAPRSRAPSPRRTRRAGHARGGSAGARVSPFPFRARRPRAPRSEPTCEGGRDWPRRSCGRSRAAASSVQKKMGFGVNLGV